MRASALRREEEVGSLIEQTAKHTRAAAAAPADRVEGDASTSDGHHPPTECAVEHSCDGSQRADGTEVDQDPEGSVAAMPSGR